MLLHEGVVMKCPFCAFSAVQPENYKRHLHKVHNIPKEDINFQCTNCPDSFLKHSLYRRHFNSVHKNHYNPEPISPPQQLYDEMAALVKE